jgi:gliding motility-associated-like protein
MKRIVVILSFIISYTYSVNAQVNLCLGQDATVCVGTPVSITNCTPGGAGGGTTGGIYLNAPTNVTLWDDVWSGVVNIGFPFSFYGNNYNQCVIGSNGLVSFDLSKANGYCAWSLSGVGALPNAGFIDAKNSAMGCYQDMNPGMGGQVQYQTVGTAPNRIFVVLYREIPMFSCGLCTYMSIMLYEGSNNVEFHIGNKPPCNTWNGGLAIQGTENAGGTVAHITPGRNNTQWAANQECKRFTPTSPAVTTAYTISTAPYLLVTSSSSSLVWGNTNGQTFPYNNGVLNIPSAAAGTTGYFLTGSACGVGIGSITPDTTWITGVTSSVAATSTPDICSSGIGTVTANPTSGLPPYTFNWPALGQTTQTVNGVYAGTYLVQMTDATGCTSNATVVVGDTPASFSGTTTVVSCPGGADGSATAVMTPPLGNITYQWDDPAAQTTATATGLSAGTYNCIVTSDIGCQGVVSVTVSEIPGMIGSISNQSDVTCNSSNDGVIQVTVTQGTPAYTYSWDNSVSTSNIANDLYAGTHTVTITDANGCTIDVTGTIGEPSRLMVIYVTPDSMICAEDDITLSAIGTGGSSPYTFTWLENGTPIGTGTSITVDPAFTNTQYCVVLSEACGSPTHDSCMVVTFPTPIDPSITPNKLEDCIPGFFEFANTSTNGGEIATTYFEFSDGTSIMETGADSTSNTFEIPNFYSCNMTITSIYGCVYTGSFNNIIEVKPLPVADFTFSSNPATFFETSIQLQDRSSVDVIDWEWFSPGSSPMTSTSQNPVFTFPEGEVGTYPVTLMVTTEHGCTDTVTYIMNVVSDILFYAPNTFTPDDDEYNQSWGVFVEGIDIYHFDLYIFNRWGEMIWESHDKDAKWDGTYGGEPVPQGTYVWRASAKDKYNDGKYEFQGHINVIR